MYVNKNFCTNTLELLFVCVNLRSEAECIAGVRKNVA